MRQVIKSFIVTAIIFCTIAFLGVLVTLCIGYPLTIFPLVLFLVIWFSIYKYVEIHYEK
jgi:hypothetical protein